MTRQRTTPLSNVPTRWNRSTAPSETRGVRHFVRESAADRGSSCRVATLSLLVMPVRVRGTSNLVMVTWGHHGRVPVGVSSSRGQVSQLNTITIGSQSRRAAVVHAPPSFRVIIWGVFGLGSTPSTPLYPRRVESNFESTKGDCSGPARSPLLDRFDG